MTARNSVARLMPRRLAITLAGSLLLSALAAAPVRATEVRGESGELILTENTFAAIAEKTLPSVVAVYVKASMKDLHERLGALEDRFKDDPSMRRFFKEFEEGETPGGGEDPHSKMFETRSSGSGVIIDSRGYIVTNLHIIAGAEVGTISVVLHDDTEIPMNEVEVVATDELIDLAVLKVPDSYSLAPLEWGDSESMRIGDWVVAIGNPLDLRGSVSRGIVSAKARKIDKVAIEHLIQTDAMINPGNSGGALVNLKGKLIGINMAIATTSGFFQGIGFAIPASDARFITDQVIEYGRVRRGFIGVGMQDVDSSMGGALGLAKDEKGIMVNRVEPDQPADKAGVQLYDVITHVDGREITETGDLLEIIASKKVGDDAKLEIVRMAKGKRRDLELTMRVGERPTPGELARQQRRSVTFDVPDRDDDPVRRIGLSLWPYAGGDVQGLEVVNVRPRSPAWRAGIKAGDIILELNRTPVKGEKDFEKAVGESPEGAPHLVFYLSVSKESQRPIITTVERE